MKPSLPQGTRDFAPDVVRKRQYILNTIKEVFELYGFQPLETPAMENLETLMGKYGDEGDKLIFKILNNEDLIKGIDKKDVIRNDREAYAWYLNNNVEFIESLKALPAAESNEGKEALKGLLLKEFEKYFQATYLSKRALKYDLTIPFARYVAMNHGQLTFPFKRYQIQPVWRADRPQRGRYREFYQCDADVVGSKSLLNEVELANIYATVFHKLNVPVEIKLNNRKILAALAEIIGSAERITDITVAIDKLDKIGLEKVKEELEQRGLSGMQIEIITQYLLIANVQFYNEMTIERLRGLFQDSPMGLQGLKEMEYVVAISNLSSVKINIDPSLARGLNYYTGTIFEVKAKHVNMGSIGGGGRYDDLTGLFGVPNIPGVGISFGVDRIYDVMEELNLFPATIAQGSKALFFNLGEEESKTAFRLLQGVRAAGIAAEIFHEAQKFDKQFKYAEKKGIPCIVIIGSAEIAEGQAVVKTLSSGQQEKVPFDALPQYLSAQTKTTEKQA